jgi:drug/metabolite transporter (DMT)-like permease
MSRSAPAAGAPAGTLVAALAVPALGLLWGLNWPTVRVLLGWWSPWTIRTVGLGAGALLLLALARARGQALGVPQGQRLRLVGSALFTIVGFNLGTAFAQVAGSTSRAAIITFTMPLWATLLAWPLLGERPDRRRWLALALGVAGLALLALPLLQSRASPAGVMLALGAGMSWAAGTVLLKRYPLSMPHVAATGWQLAVGALTCALGWLAFGAHPVLSGAPQATPPWPVGAFWVALAYHILLAMAVAYLLWFDIIARLPAGVAALGTLLVPVVGVIGAMSLLGERPGLPDLLGFALIIPAAAIALLAPAPARAPAPSRAL